MEVAHIDVFRREPDRFWHFYSQRFAALGDKEPNGAHEVLAELERRGLVEAVITQNIDRLHRRAGSRRVIEVHGSIDRCVCPECGGGGAPRRGVGGVAGAPGGPRGGGGGSPPEPRLGAFGGGLPPGGGKH